MLERAESGACDQSSSSVPLPNIDLANEFNDLQWKTLMCLADTVIPSIRNVEFGPDPYAKVLSAEEYKSVLSEVTSRVPFKEATQWAAEYLEECASSTPYFPEFLERTFTEYVHKEGRNGIGFILTALNTLPGSFFLTGSTKMIYNQPFEVREQIFQGWATSRLPALRRVHRALSALFKKTWVSLSSALPPVIGYAGYAGTTLTTDPINSFEYSFLQFPRGDEPCTLDTDVVIVGSGCGAGVAAKNLAEAGLRVVVVEKSYSWKKKQFPMGLNAAASNLFQSGGADVSDDGSIAVVSGSTWGGGGTVNWSASLQTQAYVRQEWSDGGLPFFTSAEFQESLDRVCCRMGVQTGKIKHNRGNQVILEGAHKLGYSVKEVPQNTGNEVHYCGHCTLGCPSGGKKGPIETWLVDAAKAGAKFIEGYHAEKIIFSKSGGKRVAVGVQGEWTSRNYHFGGSSEEGAVRRKVNIKAKVVVVSCGTLSSPLLLLRSGIKNSQIGQNLYLHPVIAATAVYNRRIIPWEGSALTAVVDSLEDLDGHGHGVKIEAAAMVPSMILPIFPWKNGLEYKLFASKLAHMTSFISLARDRDTGRVYPDPVDGRCRIEYTTSAYDCQHIVEGLIACAKIAYISGAKEFHTTYNDMRPFICPEDTSVQESAAGVNNAALQEWIAELRNKSPLIGERGTFASAHQMGTCRMGRSPKTSVVDSNCKVWGVEGVYVMDASVFPSASGVNPMVTNMAISDWASRNLANSLSRARKDGKVSPKL